MPRQEPPTAEGADTLVTNGGEEGREGAFTQLINESDRALHRYIFHLVGHAADAAEIHQRVAEKLWRQFDSFDRERPFLPWAKKFAYFEILHWRREKARDRLLFREELLELLAQEEEARCPEEEGRFDALDWCVATLAEEDRALVHARYNGGTSVRELAATLGFRAKKLYQRLDLIRRRLAACIQTRLGSRDISFTEGL